MRFSSVRGKGLAMAAFATLAAGCASNQAGGPGPSMAGSESCKATKAQLTKLDSKGVPALVQAQAQGKKLSGAQKADADTYNRLLNEYLGARCHV